MPSEQQLQRALQEQRDLEKELSLLNNANNATESVNRLIAHIVNTKEGLTDHENNDWIQPGGCGCKIL